MKRLLLLLSAVVLLSAAARPAVAATIVLSTHSSDATPASDLDAEFDFSVSGSTLTLTVTNTGSDFRVNEVYFNGTSAVVALSFDSATHSVNGDVTAAWDPIELDSQADGFGKFRFGLTDGVGENNPNIIQPGQSIDFVFTIAGVGVVDTDFVVANASGYLAAAKFVNGPDDPESPGDEDSAFGATVVPEPTTLLLLTIGLAGLGAASRRGVV